jgi:hypothetical protein
MIENVKFIKMEFESLKYMEEVNSNPELKAQIEKDRQISSDKRMEILKIPVN